MDGDARGTRTRVRGRPSRADDHRSHVKDGSGTAEGEARACEIPGHRNRRCRRAGRRLVPTRLRQPLQDRSHERDLLRHRQERKHGNGTVHRHRKTSPLTRRRIAVFVPPAPRRSPASFLNGVRRNRPNSPGAIPGDETAPFGAMWHGYGPSTRASNPARHAG